MQNDVDGNLAALRQHEKKVDDQEKAQEYVMKQIDGFLDKIEEYAIECFAAGKDTGYDFDSEIRDYIIKRIDNAEK